MGLCDCLGNISRLLILGATAGGIILQCFAAVDCNFLSYTRNGAEGTFGLYYWQLIGETECVEYDEGDTTDSFLRAGRSMIFFALGCAALFGALVLFGFFCCQVCCFGCLETLACLGALSASGAVFVVYGSQFCVPRDEIPDELQCSFGQGATYNVMAMACYLGASVVYCCSPRPDPLIKQCSK